MCWRHRYVFFFSCDKGKDTIINGEVLDVKTKDPVADAAVICTLFRSGKTIGTYQKRADELGRFEVTLDEDEAITPFGFSKIGYLTTIGFNPGAIETQISQYEHQNTYFMTPLDGALQITFQNTLQIASKIYLRTAINALLDNYNGNIQQFYFNFPKEAYPFEVNATSTDTLQVAYPSNEMVYVFWDTIPIPNAQQAANRDSFFLAQGDTLVYRVAL